jgi:hypothetical protein
MFVRETGLCSGDFDGVMPGLCAPFMRLLKNEIDGASFVRPTFTSDEPPQESYSQAKGPTTKTARKNKRDDPPEH